VPELFLDIKRKITQEVDNNPISLYPSCRNGVLTGSTSPGVLKLFHGANGAGSTDLLQLVEPVMVGEKNDR